MRECPNCHTPVLETDKFCKVCGTPLAVVEPAVQAEPEAAAQPAAAQPAAVNESAQPTAAPEPAPENPTPQPAADPTQTTAPDAAAEVTAQPAVEPTAQPAAETPAQTMPEQPAADQPTPTPKKSKKLPIIIAAVAVAALAIVIGIVLKQHSKVEPVPTEDATESLADIFEEREFDEDLDLSQNPGLISAEQVVGPFLEIRKEDGSYYVPDTVENKDAGKKLVTGAEIVEAEKDSIPKEYRDLLENGKKNVDEEHPAAYALMEYTGYSTAGNYNNGGFLLYDHTSRVSFYDAETNELLAWMDTSSRRKGPFILYSNNYTSDGQHPILNYTGGSIWSDTAWTKGLDELFYDENGYQVVGTKLLGVPEDVDTIEVPAGVTEIAGSVGSGHTATKIVIPKGVEKIGPSAFYGSSIEEIEFPKTLKFCDISAFGDTPWMREQSDEDWVIVGDGVLMKCHDDASELVIPDDVKYIAPSAFSELKCKKITIPASVVQCCANDAGATAPITHLDSLEEVVIEGGLTADVENIDVMVLNYCDNLKKITVDCDVDDLPDGWIILYQDTLEAMEIICDNDSPVADWADKNHVKHSEK